MESETEAVRQFHGSSKVSREKTGGGRANRRDFQFTLFHLLMLPVLLPILFLLASSDPVSLVWTAPDKGVDSVAFSSDARYLAARLTTRRTVVPFVLTETLRTVQLFALGGNPDGQMLTCSSRYDHDFPGGGHSALAFSPDGRTLAVACDSKQGGVDLWDVQTSRLRTIGTEGSPCFAVTFLGTGATLASVGRGTVVVHNLVGGERQHIAITGFQSEVIASRDGKILAVGGGCTEVWRPAQPQLLFRPPMSRSVSISRNGKMLATASPGGVYLFDVGRGKLTSKYVTSGAAVVDFSPDGRLAVACGTRVRLVDVKTAVALPQTFTSSATGLTSVTFSSDGCLLAAGGRDGSVTVWDTNTGTQRYHFWLREKSWGAILAIAMFGVWLLVWFVPSMRRKHKDGRRTYRSGG